MYSIQSHHIDACQQQTAISSHANALSRAWENVPHLVARDSPRFFDALLNGLVLDAVWDTAPSAFSAAKRMRQGLDYKVLKQHHNVHTDRHIAMPMHIQPINSSHLFAALTTKHTLYLHRLDYRSAPVAALTDAVTALTGYRSHAMYVRTPAFANAGVGAHYNTHGAFDIDQDLLCRSVRASICCLFVDVRAGTIIMQLAGVQNVTVYTEHSLLSHGSHHHSGTPHMRPIPFLHDNSLQVCDTCVPIRTNVLSI